MDSRIGHEEYEAEQRKIAAYAQRKASRRERLLNARNRTLGRDTSALEAQIREKLERKEKEKREEQARQESAEHYFRSNALHFQRWAASSFL